MAGDALQNPAFVFKDGKHEQSENTKRIMNELPAVPRHYRHHRFYRLYAMLRQNIGHTFLESVRTVIAHPVSNNEFLRSIVYNFVPGTTGPKLQGKSGG